MLKPLKILIIEDSEDDCLLLLRELRRAGYEPDYERVETGEGMRSALADREWDIIISDFILPRFSGLDALTILKESGLDLPFIIVSGNIGEDIAVEAMKAGAHDYIIKGNLSRLVPAVERELREAEAWRDRKRTEIQLDQTRRRLADTLETINEGFFTLDNEWRFTYANNAAARMWGQNKSDLIGMTYWDLVPQSKGTLFDENVRKVMKEQVPVRFEAISPLIGVWVEVRAHPSEKGIAVYFHDISDRKKAEEDISHLNRLYSVLSKVNEAIVRTSDAEKLYDKVCRIAIEEGGFKMAWIGLTDPVSKRIVAVESCGDNGGYLKNITVIAADVPEGGGPTGRAVVEGKHQISNDIEHDPLMRPWRDKALSHGFRTSAAFPLRSGGEVIGAFTVYGGQPRAFTNREIELLAALAADVSYAVDSLSKEKMRKEVIRKTEVNNALLKLFTQKYLRKEYLDAACDLVREWSGMRHAGIRLARADSRIPFESCEGYTSEFLEEENALSLKTDLCVCTRIITGSPADPDLVAMTPNGSFFSGNSIAFVDGLTGEERSQYRGVCMRYGFKSLAVVPIRHQDKPIGAIHLADVREGMVPLQSVEFLEHLGYIIGEAIYRFSIEEERARLASALESTADGVVITEPSSGLIQYVNRAFEQITGYKKDELLGKNLHMMDSGQQGVQFYQDLRETILRDGVWRGQIVSKKKDGTLYYEDRTVSPVMSLSGEILYYVSLKRDITERLRLESIAESVNTMDNIGYIFSGVRHEIGNPINSVNMLLGLLSSKLPDLSQDAIRDYLDRIIGQIGRVEFLLRSLKSFNMFETQEPQNLRMALFMEQFLPLVKDDLETKGIAFDIKLDPQADRLHADPRALQQVLLNLITNATDAVREREHPKIAARISRSDGIIRIEVEDNGCGIPEDKVKDLFKPFYTTKATGTGLGLVIVKKMVTRMNGTIAIESRRDIGTVATISLPEGPHEER